MSADILIMTATPFIVLFFALVMVVTPTVVSLLGEARRELTMLAKWRSEPGADYFQWSGYVEKRQKANNMLRNVILNKWKFFKILVPTSVALGIVFPAVTRKVDFQLSGLWSFVSMECLYLCALVAGIVGPCFLWARGILLAVSNFENVREQESIDTRGHELWKTRLGVLYTGKTIPHDKDGWAWEPRRQGVFIMKDKHYRRIKVPNISRDVDIEQDLEHMDIGGNDSGWRLITVSLGGAFNERTAHIGGVRGQMYVKGDNFQSKEDLLDIADEEMERAHREWQRLEREGRLDD